MFATLIIDPYEAHHTYLLFDPLASPLPFSNNGGMQIKVGQNKAKLQITFQKNDKTCNLAINSAEVSSMGSVDMLILPDNWWAEIKDKGIDIYLGAHGDDLRVVTNMYLQGALQDAVNKVNPCQYLPF